MEADVKLKCPKCQSGDVVKIVYGYPSSELMKEAEAGKVALGGCIITDSDPKWLCKNCGNCWL